MNLKSVKAILFDFDGTLSTLRCGWEAVMRPMMNELICDSTNSDIDTEVVDYIDKSTGIQTIFQMEWLSKRVKEYKKLETLPDPWEYKKEYLRRLMLMVQQRRDAVAQGNSPVEKFHIAGAKDFLETLYNKGIKMYLASGTDDADVKHEAELLGFTHYFEEIRGAGERSRSCGKEAVLNELSNNLDAETLAVFGDGKVEIELGNRLGARTVGVASNETMGCGIDETKRERLIHAGANLIVGDFANANEVYKFLGL